MSENLNKQFLESVCNDIAWDTVVKELGGFGAMVFYLQAFEGWIEKRAAQNCGTQAASTNNAMPKLLGILCSLVDDIESDGIVDSKHYKAMFNELLGATSA